MWCSLQNPCNWMIALLQVEYRAPKLRGFGRSSFIRTAQRSSIREYCMSSMPSSLSDKVPSTGEVQYRLTRASTQMTAEKRVDRIINAGDFNASPKERVIDLFSTSNVSASIVILKTLPPDSKAYVEYLFENAIGLDLSSLLTRMRRNLFSWYSAIPRCAIVLSNSESLSSSFSKIDTLFQRLMAPFHTHLNV